MLIPEIDSSAKPFSLAPLTVSLRTFPADGIRVSSTVPYFADQALLISLAKKAAGMNHGYFWSKFLKTGTTRFIE